MTELRPDTKGVPSSCVDNRTVAVVCNTRFDSRCLRTHTFSAEDYFAINYLSSFLQIICFYSLQPFFPAIFTTNWKQSCFLFSSDDIKETVGVYQQTSHCLCPGVTCYRGCWSSGGARRQTQEGQVQQEHLQPSFWKSGRDFSVNLQQPSTELSKLDFRDLSAIFGTRFILFYFLNKDRRRPLLFQNYFLRKGNVYSGKLFTRKG